VSIAGTRTTADGLTTEVDRGWRRRRAERRRLAGQDAASARLAELHHIRALLDEAAVVVGGGWVQKAWFAVRGPSGEQVTLTAHRIDAADYAEVTGACLVGGIVHAAGGPSTVHSQLVQRTLDLTWHTLYEDDGATVRWCPSPAVRASHVRDLTRWNDDPRRTREEVVSLLRSAVTTADAQARACLSPPISR
jgi:hypothetical protein